MLIRRARLEDLSALLELCAEHADYEHAAFDPIGKRDALASVLFSATPRMYAWVVEHQAVVVGYATATREFSTWSASEYLHIDCLFLREGHRGCGAGLDLMREMARAAVAMNIGEMQ